MIRYASALPLLALAAAAPLGAQQAGNFQLPPAPAPTADNRVQGPVDSDAPVPVRPRAIETARPAPTPTASAAPAVVLPSPTPTRASTLPQSPATRPTLAPRVAATAAPEGIVVPPPASSAIPVASAPAISALPSAPPSTPSLPSSAAPESPVAWWVWLGLGGLVLGASGWLLIRRRSMGRVVVPDIVAPTLPAANPAEVLAVTVEAMRMDRSLINATVGYRITLRNRTAQALSGVAVEADLVSASRGVPTEQQLASPAQALTPRHSVERLAPGQSLRFEGQARLPLAEANAIWQGQAALLVPLLRVRATAEGAVPVATTLVIGRSEGQAARPQPFRLDEPPRSYAPLAQRVLDVVPARA